VELKGGGAETIEWEKENSKRLTFRTSETNARKNKQKIKGGLNPKNHRGERTGMENMGFQIPKQKKNGKKKTATRQGQRRCRKEKKKKEHDLMLISWQATKESKRKRITDQKRIRRRKGPSPSESSFPKGVGGDEGLIAGAPLN